jgi:hypothetical protein
MVALARHLARILFAMWRDEAEYNADRIRARRPNPAVVTDRAIAAAAL